MYAYVILTFMQLTRVFVQYLFNYFYINCRISVKFARWLLEVCYVSGPT